MGGKFFGLFLLVIGVMIFYYFYNHAGEFAKNLKNGFNIFNTDFGSSTYVKTPYKNPLDDIIISTPTPTSNYLMYPAQQQPPPILPNGNYVKIVDQSGRVVSEYKY